MLHRKSRLGSVPSMSRRFRATSRAWSRKAAGRLRPTSSRANRAGQRELAEELTEVTKTLGQVAEYWLADPKRRWNCRPASARPISLWASAAKRLAGEPASRSPAPPATTGASTTRNGSRTSSSISSSRLYLLTTQMGRSARATTPGPRPHTRQKAEFYVRQIANAVSPSNFVLTNPELLRETLTSNARKSCARHEHARRGHPGRRRQSEDPPVRFLEFEVGRNLAITPGKVIFQNDLMQLIQYAPSTEKVLKKPLLIVPPWINKYLHPRPDAGKIVHQVVRRPGHHRVLHFLGQSGRRPRARKASRITSAKAACRARRHRDTRPAKTSPHRRLLRRRHAAGLALAAMAAQQRRAHRLGDLLRRPGRLHLCRRLKVFVDEDQLEVLEQRMAERGYLEGRSMATAFNLLRSNDLIWPYVVNNYLKGKTPFPFDLLYWNSDATRMPAANHSFYLRNCYLENRLTKGEHGDRRHADRPRRVKMPIYNLATREDHIAPAKSVLLGAQVLRRAGAISCCPAPATSPAWSTRRTSTNTNIGPARSRAAPISKAGLKRRPNIPAPGGPTGSTWLKRQDDTEVPARGPATARSSRSKTRRAAT